MSMSNLEARLNNLRKLPGFIGWHLTGARTGRIERVVQVTDTSDWVIRRIAGYIADGTRDDPWRFVVDTSPRFHVNSIVHFGSAHTYTNGGYRRVHPSNLVVATIFHAELGVDDYFDNMIHRLQEMQGCVSRIVVANSMMIDNMRAWGIPDRKVVKIPIGVDLDTFRPWSKPEAGERRQAMRSELGIPHDHICIGSFQKDGDGWGEGMSPKLIKGPDLFADAVIELARERPVHCLLTGPARGYVKKRLDDAGIPYTHRFLENFDDIVDYYQCLDLYLVTSRLEGGPKAIMECMATGVPIVSTRVGMAPDLIVDGQNGFLVDVGDTAATVKAAVQVLDDRQLRDRCVARGFETVPDYDWAILVRQYADMYRQLQDESANR